MRGWKSTLYTVAALLPLFLASLPAQAGPLDPQPKFRRAECIVSLEQDGGLSYHDMDRIFRSIGAWLHANVPATVRFSWVAHPDGRIFIMYTDWCDRKHDLTLRIIESIRKEHPDIRLILMSDDVLPGPDTINSFGGAWIDGAAPKP